MGDVSEEVIVMNTERQSQGAVHGSLTDNDSQLTGQHA
jgi:hypothetical protein